MPESLGALGMQRTIQSPFPHETVILAADTNKQINIYKGNL